MKKDNIKQVLVSIIIGACVAFFTTLFQGLAQFLQTHATEVASGMMTATVYLAKTFKG